MTPLEWRGKRRRGKRGQAATSEYWFNPSPSIYFISKLRRVRLYPFKLDFLSTLSILPCSSYLRCVFFESSCHLFPTPSQLSLPFCRLLDFTSSSHRQTPNLDPSLIKQTTTPHLHPETYISRCLLVLPPERTRVAAAASLENSLEEVS